MAGDGSAGFVAGRVIPPAPPPYRTGGAFAWLKANLFSTVPNTLTTLAALYLVGIVLADAVPWLFVDSVWNAGSLSECRTIGDGACLAVINERWPQFMFGFYPADERWRPVLAFTLLLVALWPVLFASAPRKLLVLTAVWPAAAYWLVWGGTVWGPLAAMLGFVVGFAVFRAASRALAPATDEGLAGAAGAAGGALAAVLWWLFAAAPVDGALSGVLDIGLAPVESDRIGGFLLSLAIGVTGIAASLPLGVCLALGRQSDLPIVRGFCIGFIEFIRGVPLITLLFVASVLLAYFLPPGTTFDLVLRVVIMVTAFASAYMAEVIRGGLAALPRGQYEAAAALGLGYWKSMRMIVLPQALKISIPGIVNTFIGLFKDTTLVVVIGLFDPVGLLAPIRADQNWNGIVWELYGFVALFFFVFCFSMSRYSMYLERRLATDRR